MTFHPISKNKIIAELSKEDMQELDITYEELDYSNIETRRVIWTVLDKIRKYSGKDIDPSCNLLIEAVANSDGGCLLCFTIPEQGKGSFCAQKPVMTKNTSGVVFEFENADSLLDMLKSIGHDGLPSGNRLFRKNGRYRLLLDRTPAAAERRTMEEYGRFIGQNPVLTAHLLEHWEEAGKF